MTDANQSSQNQRLVEPDPREIVLCIYEPTLDGFAAAWVVRKAFREAEIPVEFVANANDGERRDDVGRNVLILGGPTKLTGEARSWIRFQRDVDVPDTVRGNPLAFRDWQRVFPYGVKTLVREPQKSAIISKSASSLVALTWDFFYGDKLSLKRPFVLDQIDDYIAGTKKFRTTNDVYAVVDSYPQDFVTFGMLVDAGEDRHRRSFMVTGGQAINRFLAKHAGQQLRIEEAQS